MNCRDIFSIICILHARASVTNFATFLALFVGPTNAVTVYAAIPAVVIAALGTLCCLPVNTSDWLLSRRIIMSLMALCHDNSHGLLSSQEVWL